MMAPLARILRLSPDARPRAPSRDRGLADLWRVLRFSREFLRGFRAFRSVGPCVTVFGSARIGQHDPLYCQARRLGRCLAEHGFAVMTGGGPGLMEAVNRGARESGGVSIGCNIELPREQHPNRYLDHWITFRHFFVRKVVLVRFSSAFIALPGGIGTMDELFETAALVQTGKIPGFPTILIGDEFWHPLLEFVHRHMVRHGTLQPDEARRLILTDDIGAAIAVILDSCGGDPAQDCLLPSAGSRRAERWHADLSIAPLRVLSKNHETSRPS